MRIGIRHLTRYDHEEPAVGLVMRLRLKPASCQGQLVEQWRVTVNDQPIEQWMVNGYGEFDTVWRAPGKVETVTLVAEGIVTTTDFSGVMGPGIGFVRPSAFLRETALTEPDAALEAFAARIDTSNGALQGLHDLCGLVHDEIAYRTASTTVETTAAQALAQGEGVCQDKTHIFIAAARLLDIPARYVTGYLHDPERPAESHQTHAWAEAHVEGLGWVAFDPTRGHCPYDCHVRLTVGFDAADAAPVRGVFAHGAASTLSDDVHIAPLPLDAGNQSQTQQ